MVPRNSSGASMVRPLVRLVQLAVDLAGDHLRLADGQLVALAAHLLDQDRQRQLAAALHLPGVGALGREHAERDVADELGVEPVLDQAGSDLVALPALADEGGRVGADGHRDRGLVDVDQRERDRVLRVGERLADGDLGDAGDGDDVTRARGLAGLALEALGDEQLGDLDVLDLAVAPHPRDLLALLQVALLDPQQRQPAEEGGGVEVGHVRLEGRALDVLGRRDVLQDRAEERLQVAAGRERAVLRLLQRRDAGLAGGEHDREVERVLAVVLVEQVHEQLVGLVDDLVDAGVATVGLVDHEDHRHVGVERLAQHEPGLRQRPLRRVDEEHDAVDHRQAALDLATEVGVTGGVDDVDRHVAVGELLRRRTAVVHRGVLREDGDALLALEVAGVHDPVGDALGLVRGERARLVEHRVDQRGLAVVDVRHDGDVPQVGASGRRLGRHGSTALLS